MKLVEIAESSRKIGRVRIRLLLTVLASALVSLSAGCKSNDYFDDGYDERAERREDRDDRREMERELTGKNKSFTEKTEDWLEDSQRRMDKDEWGNF